jgi:hypothetical protein
MLFVQRLAEFLQHTGSVGRTQGLQCYRDRTAMDIEGAGGLKDLWNELAALLFSVTVMREDPRE